MKSIKTSHKKFFLLLVYLLIGLLYVNFLSLLPNELFRDRENYLVYASTSESIISTYPGIILFFNEPFFLYFNFFLNNYIDFQLIPHLFVYIITTVYFYVIAVESKNPLTFILGLLLSVTIPYILQNELVALRQGLATAFFIIAFFYLKDEKKVILTLFICSLFHSIFFIFLFFYFLNFIFLKNVSLNKKAIINFIWMFVFSLIAILVAKFFGLRQGDEYTGSSQIGGSGGAFVVFLLTLIYIYLWGDKSNKKLYEFSILGAIIFLTSYFLTPIAGRMFNSIMPFILILLVKESRYKDVIFLLMLNIIFAILFFCGSYSSLLNVSDIQAIEILNQYVKGFFVL
ncbi:EpsG family protein [Acinetobacter kanungonis]|uniref:EpsG family protein n=1 Tax=Acinetobacter kanungonis TaxID=2699469 RepID=UPI0013796F0E|nr:EpsG family protein [Acinetobacter kanungonis]NCI79688.1 hypothetical protein [Acinetobacter kanungonis]